ncbi:MULTISPECIES: recombinase family protein [unclassified Rhizobium]|uniref:recombinase family protein n=1 Tax=unclassified Rhizobium TaxID=2613769 RepID=UPI001ADD0596|nr:MULTISPECIES: recombinase family protein [unclassified Rhizobium]MBO9102219.1 recombinase family protein [Rhizobium sp. L58/93]MBO9171922.1 recombinase family protein [Rhizobium sp. L245/93]MBO9186419.1 recombinase family protein [Rhizobium sp. E27B/91]QXZ87226.1 recombinase family protein [Rhizobium sp. K1/93]QXZ92741.1 recombinase family protein [Rhizobium sp. K15/93]
MVIHAYLQASITDEDAKRARKRLTEFASQRKWKIASTSIENGSDVSHQRPVLFRLLSGCKPGDILLIGEIDSLARLNTDLWDRLRAEITARDVRIVSADLPTSWRMVSTEPDETHGVVIHAINSTVLDALATTARTRHQHRRLRQQQGIANAKTAGRYPGRPENTRRNEEIMAMLRDGRSWESIRHKTHCSSSTIARMAKRIREKPD